MNGTNPANLTPMIRQYLDIKKRHQDAILFFRMGDFYEMFFEDATTASTLLEIALTSRNKGEENAIPFCGVPHHSATSYIARLIQAGHKVAICEQIEDPATAKGIVKRDVVRVITPGLVLESESLNAKANNYLVSLCLHREDVAMAYVDISTGDMGVSVFHDEASLLSELDRRDPREFLISSKDQTHPLLAKIRRHFPAALHQAYDSEGKKTEILSSYSPAFQQAWEKLSLERLAPLAEQASLRLLDYVKSTLKSEVGHLGEIRWSAESSFLVLDAATVRNLELVRNLQDGRVWGTLLDVLDKTQTSMGARKLKLWVLYPLAHEGEIRGRQEAIKILLQEFQIRGELSRGLAGISDLERLNSRVSTGVANARELFSLGHSLARLPGLRQALQCLDSPFFKGLLEAWDDLSEAARRILGTLQEELPLGLREGGLIRDGVLPELDELRAILKDGKSMLARMEEQEKTRTGISTLKLRYNRVFGYYIEVPQSKSEKVPADYIRKQTLANAERYITPELKTYEEKVLGAEERIRQLEFELFSKLREEIASRSSDILKMARKLAELDALLSLATVALENDYVCPEFSGGNQLFIEEGRHPVLEKLFPSARFVPNDVDLSEEECRIVILTGPNMAGKSTYLRQVALIALMAHMGSFVPAKAARISPLDRIFTRIGASDNLSKNQSTFWVEMEETANILKSATHRSLVVLDEIGRGTSTYDGLSLAWAIAEHLHDVLRAKTIFATHYHELIELAEKKEALRNFSVAVKEWQGEILFLYKIVPGGISQSYGIQVASLAGIHPQVISRAREILQRLQDKPFQNPPISPKSSQQMPLFASPPDERLEIVRKLDLNGMTPLAALQVLYDLQKKLGDPKE